MCSCPPHSSLLTQCSRALTLVAKTLASHQYTCRLYDSFSMNLYMYQGLLIKHFTQWRGALVGCKRCLKPASVDSQSQHSSTYVFLRLCVCLMVVSVFELTKVDTHTKITYVHTCTIHAYVYSPILCCWLPLGVVAPVSWRRTRA